MYNDSFLILNNSSYNINTVQILDMQDILHGLQEKYMVVLAVCSSYLFIYILFRNFIRINDNSKHFWIVSAMDEWAIIPSLFLVIIAFTYFTNFKGI